MSETFKFRMSDGAERTIVQIPKTPEKERCSSESSDCDAQFSPVIRLPLVKVPTNEENEVVVLKIRAKLYRFNNIDREWKERGLGELKILRHKDKIQYRIVMRRDKTLKVCANHFITYWMELKKFVNDRTFIYTAIADFADEESKAECFAVRFPSTEDANKFKSNFNEARDLLKLIKEKSKKNVKTDDDEEINANKAKSEDEKENKAVDQEGNDLLTKKIAELTVKEDKKTTEENRKSEQNSSE